jgi:hypothetical protein
MSGAGVPDRVGEPTDRSAYHTGAANRPTTPFGPTPEHVSLVLPISEPPRWAWLTLPSHMSTQEWDRLLHLLNSMRPGLVGRS